MVGAVRIIKTGETMIKFIKKYLVFLIGVAALVFFALVFIQTQKTTALESGQLKNWRGASIERRVDAAKILTASDKNLDLLVKCVDKMAELPDSSEMAVRDAVELCLIGIQLKENI